MPRFGGKCDSEFMTKTQYFTAASIDGYIADESNSLHWLTEVQRSDVDHFAAFFADVGAFAMGATSYEWMVRNIGIIDDPDRWRAMYGDVPCWVFTHRDLPRVPGAPIRLVSGSVVHVHEVLQDAADVKNIWLVGGGELVGGFVDHGLLDEIIIAFAPAFLGSGARLLPRRIMPSQLTLNDVVRDGQMVRVTYSVDR